MEELEIAEEIKPQLRERQTELVKILDAFTKLANSDEWAILKEYVFDRSLANIERQIKVESLQAKIDVDKLYHLQGEWAWANRYVDLNRFMESLKLELQNIKNKLK